MTLSEIIKDQLLFNGRITLPGFGSLELTKKSARITGQKIIPPGTWIVFNPTHSKDDDKLARSFASAEEIDIEEARQKVLEFIDEIVFSLNKGEAFVFEGLGKLFKDNDNTFQFEKDASFVVDFDSFGLESFELEPLAEEVIPAEPIQIEAIPEKEPVQNEAIPEKEPVQIEAIPEKKPVQIVETQFRSEPAIADTSGTGKNNRNIFWVLSGAVVVILTGFIVLKLTTPIFDNTSFTLFNFGERDSLMTSIENENKETDKALSGELEKTLDSMSKMENALVPEEKLKERIETNPLTNKEYKEFHIIAGSFKDFAHAQKLARDLILKGYPAEIIEQGNNLYRVSAFSFKDKEEGLKELQHFRGQTKNNAAWLLGLN